MPLMDPKALQKSNITDQQTSVYLKFSPTIRNGDNAKSLAKIFQFVATVPAVLFKKSNYFLTQALRIRWISDTKWISHRFLLNRSQ